MCSGSGEVGRPVSARMYKAASHEFFGPPKLCPEILFIMDLFLVTSNVSTFFIYTNIPVGRKGYFWEAVIHLTAPGLHSYVAL